MERPAQRYFCNKCGYVGNVDLHPGCDYLAYHLAPFEQNYIDQLEKELADIKKLATSPASAPENKALLEAVAEVVWYDPQLAPFPEKPGKIIDGSIAFMESAKIGTKLFSAPAPSSPASAPADCSPTLTECPRCHNDVKKCDGVFAAPTPPVSEDRKEANNTRIAELELLAHNLGRGLIRWRDRTWPGTDQAHVVYREYPALKAIDAAMQEDKP